MPAPTAVTDSAIVAGALPPNPAELIESQAMSELLSQLTERYDLVILDTAPLGVVSDSFPLLRKVDGVIAMPWIGRSTRDAAERLREQLDRLDAPVLGIVANAIRLRKRRKYGADTEDRFVQMRSVAAADAECRSCSCEPSSRDPEPTSRPVRWS